MILAFALALVGIALMGVLFAVERHRAGERIPELLDRGASRFGARSGTFRRVIEAVLRGLALIVLLPLYGAFLLVSVALSGLWRAGGASARAPQRALHHLVSRHRTNP